MKLSQELKENYGFNLDDGQFYALVFGYQNKLSTLEGEKVKSDEEIEAELSKLYRTQTIKNAKIKEDDTKASTISQNFSDAINAILDANIENAEKLDKIHAFVLNLMPDQTLVTSRFLSAKSENLSNNKTAFLSQEADFNVIKKGLYTPSLFASEMAQKTGLPAQKLEQICLSKVPEFQKIEHSYLSFLIDYAKQIAAFKLEEDLLFSKEASKAL